MSMKTFGLSQAVFFCCVASLFLYVTVELLGYVFNKSFCISVKQITLTATQREDELMMKRHTILIFWDFQAYHFIWHPGRELL